MQTVRRHVHVVDKENYGPAANRRDRRRLQRWPARICWSGELGFARRVGGHALKETDWSRPSVDEQLKLIAIESIDKVAVLIDHSDCSLNQFGIDSQDV